MYDPDKMWNRWVDIHGKRYQSIGDKNNVDDWRMLDQATVINFVKHEGLDEVAYTKIKLAKPCDKISLLESFYKDHKQMN